MKLSDGTEIGNYTIERLTKLRDDLMTERLQKLRDIEQKQSEIMKLQNDVIQIQKEALASGKDVILLNEKLNEAISKAQINN